MLKKLVYAGSWAAVLGVKKMADMMPWDTAVAAGALMGRIGYALAGRKKRVALGNLEVMSDVFPEHVRRRIACESFENMSMGLLETLASRKISPEKLEEMVSLSGEEHLSAALSAGRGVIGVSAHLGNFTFTGIKLAAEGYPFSYVFRYPDLDMLASIIRRIGRHHGVAFIPARPRKEAARMVIKSLRQNQIVCILSDQHTPGGEPLRFFGRTAETATGPVVLASRTGAKIIPMFSLRNGDGTHKVVCEPEFKLAMGGDYAEDVRRNTQRLNDLIERYVREYPAQWWWVHRRWRI